MENTINTYNIWISTTCGSGKSIKIAVENKLVNPYILTKST